MDIMNVIVSTLVIGAIGCVMHFLYGWSRENKVVAVVAATNESVWEHVKIGLTGFLIFMIYDFLQYGEMHNYWIAKGVALAGFVVIVPSVYYAFCHSVPKKWEVPVDIVEFFVNILLAQTMFFAILDGPKLRDWLFYPAFIMLFLVLGAYVMFTWVQPKLGIFRDPESGEYGIDAHKTHKHIKKKKNEVDTSVLGRIEFEETEMKEVKLKEPDVKRRIAAAKRARTIKSIDGMKKTAKK